MCLALLGPSLPSLAQDLPHNYALLIGINGYIASIEGVPTLRYAVSDATELKAILEEKNYETVRLVEDDVKRGAIINELWKLAQTAQEQDSVLIYFAGHGVNVKVGNARHTYWLTRDTTLSRIEIDGIRLTHLLDYVNDIPARRKLIILDHCHSGDVELVRAVAGAGRDASSTLAVARNLFNTEDFRGQVESRVTEGLVVLGAATDRAYEFPDLGHGLMTHVVIRALTTDEADQNNDGKLSVNELKSQVAKVGDLGDQRQEPVTQIPISIERGTNLDWILADVKRPAQELQSLLGRLEARGDLSFEDSYTCLQAIANWQTGSLLDPKDQKIVNKLKSIRDVGDRMSAKDKAQSLASFLRGLEASP
ncbi:MAG: caspase family protein [Nitrososphaera sp.]